MPDADSEQIERLRLLWQRFQFYILIGLAMMLATITGFTYRNTAYDEDKRQANADFYTLLTSVENQQPEAALAAYDKLQERTAFSALSNLANIALISVHLSESDTSDAIARISSVVESSEDTGIQRLAALRLAEVLMNTGEYDEAKSILAEHLPSSSRLLILFEERIGDIEFSRGNQDEAIDAYQRAARQAADSAQFYLPILRIKMSALLSQVVIEDDTEQDDWSEEENDEGGDIESES